MRVLLTGHKGYIGVVAAPMLSAAGHDVIGLDSGLFDGCDFGVAAPDIPEIAKDLRDVSGSDLRGVDAVVHLAALSNDPVGSLNSRITYDINHEGSIRLARLAKEAGVQRFVFSSSCSIYGSAGDEMLDETATFNPMTPYAETKVLLERDLGRLADDAFSPTYMRNATAYGASSRLRLDIVLNDFVAAAVTDGRILIKSDGTPWRPIVHIEDIVGAVIAALDAPRDVVHDQAFNVGRTEENYRVSELAEIVAATVPGCTIEYAPGGGPDKRCYRVSFEKIEKSLPAFQPMWTAARGARQLYDAYRHEGLTAEDVRSGRYTRLARISALIESERLDATLRWRDQVQNHEAAAGSPRS